MSRTFEEALTIVLVIIPISAFLAVVSYFFWTQLSSDRDVGFLMIIIIIGSAAFLEILIMFIYVLIGIRNRLEEGNQIRLAQALASTKKEKTDSESNLILRNFRKGLVK